MTIKYLKENNCLLFECISGSQAYGLATENSDTDIKGVYILPRDTFYSLTYPEQLNEDNNNIVYYELKKVIELLSKNNPNMLEMLNIPADCVLFRHPLFDRIQAIDFLSRLCKDTFAGYAMTQLKKARGLNKKILNPVEEKKKSILDFCYVTEKQGSKPLMEFLIQAAFKPENCGLVSIPHMRGVYGLYYSEEKIYRGIVHSEDSLDVTVSSVSEREIPVATMAFNKDGYSTYCKDYKEYWDWVKKRNTDRYESTIAHGKNYDAKNMMHTFRLLSMAEEIGLTGNINVRRPDRDFLLDIKNGKYDYDDLTKMADERLKIIEEVFAVSSLPENPELNKINELMIGLRKEFYKN